MNKTAIVSSHRPHKGEGVFATNQIRAKQSWNDLFGAIYYFGPHEQDLESPPNMVAHTHFVEYEPFPHIWAMAEFMSKQDMPYVTFSNADIVLTPDYHRVLEKAEAMGLDGGQSRRRDLATKQFLPNPGGFDIWFLRPEWWGKVSRNIPKEFRLGHHFWDTWILMFMRRESKPGIGDFTPVPCVFHPEHGDRKLPYNDEIKLQTVDCPRVDTRIVV